ncbi:MAG TPA: peptidoglycan DD-metalloendopeptidase family protein [Thermoanaerobaculia bacterium]|jgi:murein DD-endopeptidase MepM/ murein hydrolase activator NlpD|nr:peptidoglycan DD-metalloendopeptidase family protein [Thermoanaerobaculia bacterium]
MSREKRPRRRGPPVLLAVLGGYALGAATVLLVLWVYGLQRTGGLTADATRPWPPGATLPPAARPPSPIAVSPTPPSPNGQGSTTLPPSPGAAVPRVSPPSPGAAPPSAPPPPPPPDDEIAALRHRRLLLPVQGVRREQLVDSFADSRTGHLHEALDIMAARGTPVLAVEDGRLAKLFFSRQGGNTVYEFDPAATYAYYYAHLDRYADGLREGAELQRGQVIGYVGTTGNAPPNAPHLHFAIFRLNADKHWWEGTALDPFLVLAPP